jgi:hypothetical protein
MTRSIQDAVAEVKAAFPECRIGYTIYGLSGKDPVTERYIEKSNSASVESVAQVNGFIVAFGLGRETIEIRINRDLAEDLAFDVVRYVRESLKAFDHTPRPLDGMRMKGSG